jgi:hypothetical protein
MPNVPAAKGTALDHPLVRSYLRSLDRALTALPAWRADELREQITAHLTDALGPDASDAGIAAVLSKLGTPADLAAEAASGGPVPQPARPRRSLLLLPRLGWRAWTAAGAAVAVIGAASAYAIALATATPIEFFDSYGWWYPRDSNHEVDTEADGAEQLTVPIRSGQPQGFVINVINPSGTTQTVLGAAPGSRSPGSANVRVRLAPANVTNGGFAPRRYRYVLPEPIPPHQARILRVLWTSTVCLSKSQSSGIDKLKLRVRVGWITRTEVVALPAGFYLSGPSHGPCGGRR